MAGLGTPTPNPPSASTITELSFDLGDRLRSITDNPTNPAATIGLDYDHLDRLIRQATSLGTVDYTYDAASRRETMSVSGQSVITYGYDNADRLKTLTQAGKVVAYDYDTAHRRRKLSLPNGLDIVYNFNAPDLTGIEYKQGTTLLGNFTYGYDLAGRITTIGGSLSATNLPAPVTAAAHGVDHRLNTRNTDAYTYDLEGNIKTRDDVCGTTTYTWNVKNQLTNIQGYRPDCQALTASFTYDALGRRKTKTVNGTTTSFLYDGYTPVQEKQGSTVYNLLTGPGIDEYLARSDGTTTRYFLPDHLGSTVYLADPAGALKTRYTYSPFGETSQTGEASTNPFQYTGRENDNTGLYYYRARYYDPLIKRFVTSDPIGFGGGDVNLYAYVRNKPTIYRDPSGNGPWVAAACAAVDIVDAYITSRELEEYGERLNELLDRIRQLERICLIDKTGTDDDFRELQRLREQAIRDAHEITVKQIKGYGTNVVVAFGCLALLVAPTP